MTTITPAVTTDLRALVTEVTARVITSVGYEPREQRHVIAEEVDATLKQLGYGHCAYCQHPGGPAELEKINNGPSFACRDQKACLRRQTEQELSIQLGLARSLVTTYNDPTAGRDTGIIASVLADRVKLIDHLLARLGVDGAELHPELED